MLKILLLIVWALWLAKISVQDIKTKTIEYPYTVFLLFLSSLLLSMQGPLSLLISIITGGLALFIAHKLQFHINDKMLLLSMALIPYGYLSVATLFLSFGAYSLIFKVDKNVPLAPFVLLASLISFIWNIESFINYW